MRSTGRRRILECAGAAVSPHSLACLAFVGLALLASCLKGESNRPLGSSCLDGGCAPGLICLYGRCRSSCFLDRDCPDGSVCVASPDNNALRACTMPDEMRCQENECPPLLVCERATGLCRNECEEDTHCGEGRWCLDTVCLDVPPPTDADADADGDGGVEADAAQDAETRVDADAEVDADVDAGVDADGDASVTNCDGVPCDSASEICVIYFVDSWTRPWVCEPVPRGCEETRTCACAGPHLCQPDWPDCFDASNNIIGCTCPGC